MPDFGSHFYFRFHLCEDKTILGFQVCVKGLTLDSIFIFKFIFVKIWKLPRGTLSQRGLSQRLRKHIRNNYFRSTNIRAFRPPVHAQVYTPPWVCSSATKIALIFGIVFGWFLEGFGSTLAHTCLGIKKWNSRIYLRI